MFPLSLEHETEMLFWRAFGEVHDRGDYLVISTPHCREWFWGNLLIFPAPPAADDVDRWPRLFRAEFGGAAVRHQLFAWREAVPAGDEVVAAFRQRGFKPDSSVALTGAEIANPPYPNTEVQIRAFNHDAEWQQAIARFLEMGWADFPPDAYERFIRTRFADYRRLAEAGAGNWYGAFIGGELVAQLGLYCVGRRARFQAVMTASPFRGRGICGTLIAQVARQARARGTEELVIVTGENHRALRIYERLGFYRKDRGAALLLPPPQTTPC